MLTQQHRQEPLHLPQAAPVLLPGLTAGSSQYHQVQHHHQMPAPTVLLRLLLAEVAGEVARLHHLPLLHHLPALDLPHLASWGQLLLLLLLRRTQPLLHLDAAAAAWRLPLRLLRGAACSWEG